MILAALCATAPAGATTVMRQSAAQLVDGAELIFTGTALHQDHVTTVDGRYAYTFITFEVGEVLKGETRDAHLTLRFDGGPVGIEETLEIAGMPRFEAGGRYLLFVAGNGVHGCPVLGWSQGKLDIRRHPLTGEESLVDRTGSLVGGIARGDWQRSEIKVAADGSFVERLRPLAEVVSQEGVEIIGGPVIGLEGDLSAQGEASLQSLPVPAAADVLAELRSLIERRSTAKSFRVGRMVESAEPQAAPPQRVFRAITSRQAHP